MRKGNCRTCGDELRRHEGAVAVVAGDMLYGLCRPCAKEEMRKNADQRREPTADECRHQ